MAGDTLSVPVSEFQLSSPENEVGKKIVMLPLFDLARMLSGRAPWYSGTLSEIAPTDPVFALTKMGFLDVSPLLESAETPFDVVDDDIA